MKPSAKQPENKGGRPPGTGRAMPVNRRRELVTHYVRLYGNTSPTFILRLIQKRSKMSVDIKTIKDDIDVLKAETRLWADDLTGGVFMDKMRQRYQENNEQIARLRKLIGDLLEEKGNAPRDLIRIVKKADDKKLYNALVKIIDQSQKSRIAGKVAYLSSILIQHMDWELSMVTGVPLLQKLESYETQAAHPSLESEIDST